MKLKTFGGSESKNVVLEQYFQHKCYYTGTLKYVS